MKGILFQIEWTNRNNYSRNYDDETYEKLLYNIEREVVCVEIQDSHLI